MTKVASLFLLLAPAVSSHQIILEKEIDECLSSGSCYGDELEPDNPNDSSFENPQEQPVVPGEGEGICRHNLYGIANSQALFGFLNAGDDFDVYNYNVTWDDFLQAQALGPPYNIPGQPVALISASVFPQACANTMDHYFSLALIADPFKLCTVSQGPLPATDYDSLPPALAAKLPPGKTVVFVTDEVPDSGYHQDRDIYKPPAGYLGELQWFLPKGCSHEVLPDGDEIVACAEDAKTISVFACNSDWVDTASTRSGVDPIPIQFVVFGEQQANNTGRDYTLNIGISEACTEHSDILALMDDNEHMVEGCVPMTSAAPAHGATSWCGGLLFVACVWSTWLLA